MKSLTADPKPHSARTESATTAGANVAAEEADPPKLPLWISWLIIGGFLGLWLVILGYSIGSFNMYNTGMGAAGTLFRQGQDVPIAYVQLDSFQYIDHAQKLAQQGGFRYHYTYIDNAPWGRGMHWASLLIWLLAGAGWIRHFLTGAPLLSSIDIMGAWINPILSIIFLFIITRWALRRFGVMGGIAAGTGFVAQPSCFEVFDYAYADHHGIILAFSMAGMLSLVAAGMGWVRTVPRKPGTIEIIPDEKGARGLMIASGIWWGFAIWMSMSSTIFLMGGVGIGIALAILMFGGPDDSDPGFRLAPDLWKLWGNAGAITSLFFYLLEYFPGEMGLHLEVNHPLYAAAWWSGGQLLSRWAEWRRSGDLRTLLRNPLMLVIPVILIAIPPAILYIFKSKYYAPADPFLAKLYKDYIYELRPLTFLVNAMHMGWGMMFIKQCMPACLLVITPVILLLSAIGVFGQKSRASIGIVLATWVGALVMCIVGFIQIRWLTLVPTMTIPMLLCLLPVVIPQRQKGSAALIPKLGVGAFCGIMLWVFPISQFQGMNYNRWNMRIPETPCAILGIRDIALLLRNHLKDQQGTVLASPNGSVTLQGIGKFKVLGTLYWENVEGLRNAASVYAAQSNDEAWELFKKHRITHFVIVSWENFIEPYIRLHFATELDYTNPRDVQIFNAKLQNSFGIRMAQGKDVPPWLKRIGYQPPSNLGIQAVLYELSPEAAKEIAALEAQHPIGPTKPIPAAVAQPPQGAQPSQPPPAFAAPPAPAPATQPGNQTP